MNRWVRGGFALGLGFGLTFVAIEIEENSRVRPEPNGTPLGTFDPTSYCRHEFGTRARAVHPGEGAYGWRCWIVIDGLLNSLELDADRACEISYGEPAYGEVVRFDDPFGWLCRRGSRAPSG